MAFAKVAQIQAQAEVKGVILVSGNSFHKIETINVKRESLMVKEGGCSITKLA
jgi:hypothetical protein